MIEPHNKTIPIHAKEIIDEYFTLSLMTVIFSLLYSSAKFLTYIKRSASAFLTAK